MSKEEKKLLHKCIMSGVDFYLTLSSLSRTDKMIGNKIDINMHELSKAIDKLILMEEGEHGKFKKT